jgi:hypothetical protein
MIRNVELHDAFAKTVEALTLGAHDDAFGHRRGAGRGRAAPPFDLIRHNRQEPNASSISVAQSFGISIPVSIAARMIEVPSGIEICLPSMDSETIFSDLERGVP